MREMRYVIFWLCFIGITFYVVKRGKKYTDFHQVFSILYKLRFLLLCGFLIVIVSNFITTYDPSQSDYAIITDFDFAGQKAEIYEKTNTITNDISLVYNLNGKYENSLISSDYQHIVYLDKTNEFTIYNEQGQIEPVEEFTYNGDSYSIYVLKYFDESIYAKRNNPLPEITRLVEMERIPISCSLDDLYAFKVTGEIEDSGEWIESNPLLYVEKNHYVYDSRENAFNPEITFISYNPEKNTIRWENGEITTLNKNEWDKFFEMIHK